MLQNGPTLPHILPNKKTFPRWKTGNFEKIFTPVKDKNVMFSSHVFLFLAAYIYYNKSTLQLKQDIASKGIMFIAL